MPFPLLKSAAQSLKSCQYAIDVVANNIANLNTAGFKRSTVNFESLVSTYRGAPAYSGTRVSSTNRDFSQGNIKATGIFTDLALSNQKGFFVLSTGAGQLLYTRDGSFNIDKNGDLVNSAGFYVLGVDGNKINFDLSQTDTVEFTPTGEVNLKTTGQEDFVTIAQLQLAAFTNPNSLESIGGNTYRQTLDSGDPVFMTASEPGTIGYNTNVVSGALEGSNAQIARELVDLMAYQRAYQAEAKVVTAGNEMLQALFELS